MYRVVISSNCIIKIEQSDLQEILETLGSLGYILFLFQSSVKMEWDRILTERKAVTIGLAIIICPSVIGFILLRSLTIAKRIDQFSDLGIIGLAASLLISDIIRLTFINIRGLIWLKYIKPLEMFMILLLIYMLATL